MAEFQFTPEDGFKNATSFPDPSTKEEARAQVQSLLDQLKDALNTLDLDKATKAEVAAIVLGQITDGSLLDVKLSNEAGEIKERVSTHIEDDTRHITDGALGGLLSIKSGTISNGGTIPQTAGYTNYHYIVSVNSLIHDVGGHSDSGNDGSRVDIKCSVNQSTRVVSITLRLDTTAWDWSSYIGGVANYTEIAW